ncbi:MAG: hypothetical protein V3T22_03510 [Planctomycetota bacterium]
MAKALLRLLTATRDFQQFTQPDVPTRVLRVLLDLHSKMPFRFGGVSPEPGHGGQVQSHLDADEFILRVHQVDQQGSRPIPAADVHK